MYILSNDKDCLWNMKISGNGMYVGSQSLEVMLGVKMIMLEKPDVFFRSPSVLN